MSNIKSYLFSPALPATTLLYGMVFCLAFVQFAGLRWNSFITISLYGGLFAWVVLLAWRQRALLSGLGAIDTLFCVFVLWVFTSLLIQGPDQVAWRFGRYLPFLVILPYVCGRLMRAFDLRLFYNIIMGGSVVLLMLLAFDYWQHLSTLKIYSRWPFFGHDYAVLLVAMLLAASLVIFSFFFLTGPGKSCRELSSRQLVQLGILGLIAAALVAAASRGALLVGIFGTLCVVLLVKYRSFSSKFQFLLFLAVIMSSAYLLLPKQQAQIYAKSLALPDTALVTHSRTLVWGSGDLVGGTWDPRTRHPAAKAGERAGRESVPIFGASSCRPIEQGVDSIAIRFVFYQEAKAMFINSPLWGVGPASFGRYSCAGVMGYPHSTILQSFAELGIVGGLLYCGLLIVALVNFIRQTVTSGAKTENAVEKLTLSLFVMYLLTDQLYGNYFMAVGSYFMIGVAASRRANPAWNAAPELGNA